MVDAIRFGTDGWRGVMAENFTFANLRLAVQAYAQALREVEGIKRPVVVGYDTRFSSRAFAHTAAEVLAGNGLNVWLANDVSPTPSVSKAIVREKLAGGLVITASHNPSEYNGLKIKASYGGPAFPEMTAAIEKGLDSHPVQSAPEGSGAWRARVKMVDLRRPYLRDIKRYMKMRWVKRAAGRVVIDPMHGAGVGYMADLLKGMGFQLQELHADRRTDFGGLHPEPIEDNLRSLVQAVKTSRAKVGLATDGDGDRIGVVDETGRVVDSQHLMALLLWHLVKHRGWKGKGSVVKTNAVTLCLDRMAKAYGLPLRLTPIGFKHIAQWIIREPVLIGGEESGGMSFYGYMPERDGILASMLLLELMGVTGEPLSHLVARVEKEFGAFFYQRKDLRLSEPSRAALIKRLAGNPPARFGGVAVREKTELDGVKYFLENGAWVLFRLSGTEPLLRLYVEAPSKKLMSRLIREGLELVQEASSNPSKM